MAIKLFTTEFMTIRLVHLVLLAVPSVLMSSTPAPNREVFDDIFSSVAKMENLVHQVNKQLDDVSGKKNEFNRALNCRRTRLSRCSIL